MNTTNESQENLKEYFDKISASRESFTARVHETDQRLSEYLKTQDLRLLNDLIIYLERGEGYLLLKIDPSFRKLLHILRSEEHTSELQSHA